MIRSRDNNVMLIALIGIAGILSAWILDAAQEPRFQPTHFAQNGPVQGLRGLLPVDPS